MNNSEDDETDEGSTFVSLAEVAEELSAGRSTVRAWLEEADVPAFVFGSGRNAKVRYRREDIEEFVASAEEGAEEEDEEPDDQDPDSSNDGPDDDDDQDDVESNPAEASDDDLESDDDDES